MTIGAIPQRRHPSRIRGAAAAALGPAVVTLFAIPESRPSTTTAAMLYVLAVALAAGMGGPAAGVIASSLSFIALNFFFTPPLHTLQVDKAQDLVALMVFLLVSVITGLLLSTAVHERAHAETREAQTRLLNQFTTRLLSGRPLEETLEFLATGLVSLLDLEACEITTTTTDPVIAGAGGSAGARFEIELEVKGGSVGTVRVWPGSSRGLSEEDEAVVTNIGGQLSLALESIRLTDEVQLAQIDIETNRLRAALFSGVTHDLRTPLAAITASVTSLIEGSRFTVEENYEHLDTIRQEAEHLNRVVTNLMDLARLRAGALVPARVPAAIDELIEAVVARLQPLLSKHDVVLRLHEDLPEMRIDIVQIDQVLTNLIENAVKFSPPGSPIEISAVGSDDQVRVTVTDRGPGIPEEDRDRVFQAFERGEGEIAGTGLGLSIARAAVVAHGGRMWIHDTPSGGASVTFELPTGVEVDA